MTIIHIVEPFASGVALFVRLLTEAMPDDTHIIIHGERREEISAEEVKKKFNQPKVRFIRWRSAVRKISLYKDISAFIELCNILRRLNKNKLADAVHLHSSKSGFLGRAACRFVGIKNVFYTPNGASFLSTENRFISSIYRLFEKIGNRFGGKVICSSLSELDEYRGLGIDASYINNGTDIKKVKGWTGDAINPHFRIVTSGRLEDQKNPLLFNAIASYFANMPEFEFIWIGDGKQKHQLQSKNIRITGWVSPMQVHQLLDTATLYLSTSRYEGLSFAVLEALALNKPVLLSNCTGNSDLVKLGINGDLFNDAYEGIVKIMQYANNKEMLSIMGRYSTEICHAEFDGSRNFKSYRNYYSGQQSSLAQNKIWILN